MTPTTAESAPKPRAARLPIVRLVILAIAVGVIACLAWRFNPLGRQGDAPGVIAATGTIEATEVDIAAEIGGLIEVLAVDEGDRVAEGDLIAKIDSSRIEAEVRRAEAALGSARAVLEDLEAGARTEELDRARAEVKLAQAGLDLAEADWRRIAELFDEGVASANQRDTAKANADTARSRLDAAKEALRLLDAGSRPDQIEAARWRVKEAEAAVHLAHVNLDKTRILSPLDGVVLVKDAEQGEVVSPGVPIVTVADLEDMWVKIYIDEADLGKTKLGQHARVRVDSFPEREFAGQITYISDEAEFTPKNIQTREDRVKLVFAVKVGLDNAGGLLKPGMYADIELEALSPGE